MANTDPIYISINDHPAAVLRVMDGLSARHAQQVEAVSRRSRVPRWLFLASLPCFALDWLMGYNYLTFTLLGAGLVVASIAAGRGLRRARPGAAFPPHFETAREVLHTLRDDPDPRRVVFGHLDLSGPEQPAKRFREGTNARGLAMEFYRDEWLSLKAKLYDGNMLRVSAIERVKVRKSYWKRSAISGKSKLKPRKLASEQQLKVRVSANPELYEVAERPSARPGAAIGHYTITAASTQGGIVDLTACAAVSRIAPADILGLLRVAYDQLNRKA